MDFLINLVKYFFDPFPPEAPETRLALIIITILILALSIGIRLYLKKKKEDKIMRKLFKNIPGRIQNIAVALGLYIGFRYAGVPFVSMRIIQYIIFAIFLYFLIQAAIIYKKEYPLAQSRKLEQAQKNKYLPGKKKRG